MRYVRREHMKGERRGRCDVVQPPPTGNQRQRPPCAFRHMHHHACLSAVPSHDLRLRATSTVSSEQGENRTRRRWVTREEGKWVPWMEKGCASLGTGGGAATLYQSSSASSPSPPERYERRGSVVVGGNARSDLGQTNEP
jgi:hypothetical protein